VRNTPKKGGGGVKGVREKERCGGRKDVGENGDGGVEKGRRRENDESGKGRKRVKVRGNRWRKDKNERRSGGCGKTRGGRERG